MTYVDRDNQPIKLGDILDYNEGFGGARHIHEVVNHNGKLCGVVRVNKEYGLLVSDDKPIELAHYTFGSNGTVCTDARVIGNAIDDPTIWQEILKEFFCFSFSVTYD